MNQPFKALPFYTTVYGSGVLSDDDKIHYAHALVLAGEYDRAQAIADELGTSLERLEQLDKISMIKMDTQSYTISNHWLNSEHDDFGPTLYKNGVVFSSNRERPGVIQKKYAWNQTYFLDMYYADVDSSYRSKVFSFSNLLNSVYHEGSAAFSDNLNTIYFTRNNFTEGKKRSSNDGVNKLKLYKSNRNKDGKSWEKAEELWFNSDEYSTGHPTVSAEGTMMYFASDRPGTLGEADIFYSTLENGEWSEPVNLGDKINTLADELFPYIHQDSILYFASKGHYGLGGLDIYRVNLNDTNAVVENMGQPINSPYDDFALVQRGSFGFFSSNRPGGKGGDDIYRFYYEQYIPEYMVAVTVVDAETKEELEGYGMNIIKQSDQTPVVYQPLNAAATIFKSEPDEIYTISAFHRNYLMSSVDCFVNEELAGDTLYVQVLMDKLKVGKTVALSNVYYDLDKAEIRPDAALELDKLVAIMEDNPDLRIELSSHTDSRGDDMYNLDLSQRRAQAAVDYIVASGVARERLSARGYGETRPVNPCVNGVKCSDAAYSLNRRTEFTIISNETKENSVTTTSIR